MQRFPHDDVESDMITLTLNTNIRNHTMKRFIMAASLPLFMVPVFAEDPEPEEKLLNLRLETRLDWQGNWDDGDLQKDYSGFAGKFLNIRLDGNITPNLSYSWRQRLNKMHKDTSFFDATDWIYLNWDIDRWSFAGGKQVVAIGGWEYDRAPIDLYGCSVFWNNIPCYDIGASVQYHFSGSDALKFQFCQSPFYTSDNRNMYAYNVMWNGSHGIFTPIYSLNFIEYIPGEFMNYIALGNKFDVDKVSLELDVMNRTPTACWKAFKDMSVMAEVQYRPTGKWNIFGKFTYDVNKSGSYADVTVQEGTELKMAGAGVEFFPFKNSKHTLAFHANVFYSWGHNANSADLMQNKTLNAAIGVKWCMNLLSLKK